MKDNVMKFVGTMKSTWQERTKGQKRVFVGSLAIIIIIAIGLSFLVFNTKFVPIYTNLSLGEVGQVKEELDLRGVSYELEDGGTTIKVPEDKADSLIVDLAGQGIPTSGNTDYSFFSENASWGITDNEFSMIQLDAMNTELANLIKGIEGISDANVMITLPKDTVFVSDVKEEATAAIMIDTQPGYQFKGNQIEALHHLVSKAVPNLPPENILIMNQYFEYFDSNTQSADGGDEETYAYQQTVKKDIERDIQRRVQQMLGSMVGADRVIVSVTADVDFTKENRIEEIVDPVDLENMEGLPVSIESIHETYSGGAGANGTVGTGEEDIANYPAGEGDDGEYELIKETINNDFNRIRKDIVESPFKIRDLGIQVAIDNVLEQDGNDIEYLTQQEQSGVEEGVLSILNSIISTSVDKEYGDIDTDENISIVFQEFSGAPTFPTAKDPVIPTWLYIVGGVLLVIIIVLIIMLLMRRTREPEQEEFEGSYSSDLEIDVAKIDESPETETTIRKKQLEKMAGDKPEDFAKLLRSWISDD